MYCPGRVFAAPPKRGQYWHGYPSVVIRTFSTTLSYRLQCILFLMKSIWSCHNHELLVKCEEVFETIQVSTVQAKHIQIATQNQAQSRVWFIYRVGRVTASRFKSAVCTNVAQPSQSLIKTICYPDRHKFTSLATWGCEHEKTARDAYIVQKTS